MKDNSNSFENLPDIDLYKEGDTICIGKPIGVPLVPVVSSFPDEPLPIYMYYQRVNAKWIRLFSTDISIF